MFSAIRRPAGSLADGFAGMSGRKDVHHIIRGIANLGKKLRSSRIPRATHDDIQSISRWGVPAANENAARNCPVAKRLIRRVKPSKHVLGNKATTALNSPGERQLRVPRPGANGRGHRRAPRYVLQSPQRARFMSATGARACGVRYPWPQPRDDTR